MKNQERPDETDAPDIKRGRNKPRLSRRRMVMGLLLIVAIPIFIGLANKAVRENADAIRQGLGQ
jgi:hypothetical protein